MELDRRGASWRAHALVLASACAVIALARPAVFPRLSWNDEIVYAVVARNIVDGRGPISSYYRADAILAAGYPLGDVHMPAFAYILSAAFRLFGPSEAAAILPSQLALALTAWLLLRTASPLFGTRPATVAALSLLVFPPMAAFANTAMSESTLVLLSALVWWAWSRCWTRPTVASAFVLAVTVAASTLHRETSFVFLPACAAALARYARGVRLRAATAFVVTLALALYFVFLPLARMRAPQPHYLSDVVGAASAAEASSVLWANFVRNLAGLAHWRHEAWQYVYVLHLVILLAPLGAFRRGPSSGRPQAAFVLAAFAGTLLPLLFLYPMTEWHAVRALVFLLPPALAVTTAVWWPASPRARLAAAGLVLAGGLGVWSVLSIGADRRRLFDFGHRYAQFILEHTASVCPRFVTAPKAYRYGWEAFPVSIQVWNATELKEVRALSARLPIDAVVVRTEEKRRFVNGVAAGLYGRRYVQVSGAPLDGRYHVFVAEGAGCGVP